MSRHFTKTIPQLVEENKLEIIKAASKLVEERGEVEASASHSWLQLVLALRKGGYIQ